MYVSLTINNFHDRLYDFQYFGRTVKSVVTLRPFCESVKDCFLFYENKSSSFDDASCGNYEYKLTMKEIVKAKSTKRLTCLESGTRKSKKE